MVIVKRVVLDVTSKCNLQCPMCWGPPRKYDSVSNEYIDCEPSINEIKYILEFMKSNFSSNVLTINGGEPLLRKDLIDIIILAKSLDYAVTLSTNAVLFESPEILKHLDAISIPIDSMTEKISKIMRKPLSNHHFVALKAMKMINDSGVKIHLKASTVVSGINKDEILLIGEEMQNHSIKVDTWKLFQYKAVGYRKDNAFKKNLKISKADFSKIAESAKKRFPQFNVYSQFNDDKGIYLLIRPDGSVTTQEDNNGVKNPHLGNILNDDAEKLIKNIERVAKPEIEAENSKASYNL